MGRKKKDKNNRPGILFYFNYIYIIFKIAVIIRVKVTTVI